MMPTLIAVLLFQAVAGHVYPKPEPTDVPPIQKFVKHVEAHYEAIPCPIGADTCPASNLQILIPAHDEYRTICADTRRVLLTGEDGLGHCILFGRER